MELHKAHNGPGLVVVGDTNVSGSDTFDRLVEVLSDFYLTNNRVASFNETADGKVRGLHFTLQNSPYRINVYNPSHLQAKLQPNGQMRVQRGKPTSQLEIKAVDPNVAFEYDRHADYATTAFEKRNQVFTLYFRGVNGSRSERDQIGMQTREKFLNYAGFLL
jgi:hypothetical protein